MVNAHYWCLWHDDRKRLWAYRFDFDKIPDARAAHKRSLEWNWVKPTMSDPVVTDLVVRDQKAETTIAAGSNRNYETRQTPFG